ncbi:Actinohivin [Pseudolycoriella hygida]|uniref:Actinohivin n=1 Tax=Pseudolycoriella hygida TaxID=35572 RepID=A0A9Q0NDK3_9DIPT|nr:Actinohivin [Pseudolycoriella hygida]
MWFYIQNIQTGLVLDVTNDGKGEIITYPYHGGNNQLWRYENDMIYSKLNGFVMDIEAKESKVILYPPHGGMNQKWVFDHDFSVRSHLGKVMDIAKKDKSWSGRLIAYPKHGGPNQKFRRVYV